ncbi:AI-2E family transporter [Marinigracilibium pacificum]|uniref:AI-2E family transporter n=1 Tax=Marinigracilibium pacificum TaxID=2729599 RepID=A0A848J1F8_9BACT|nr:AI-2E family transporter [Marinigracilibium pacificum]NMM48314.1 AI-2E family transporter [Marinigracilibium pacificum]
MKNVERLNERFKSVAEITIRLGFLLLLIAWCLRLLYPFSGIIVWGMILALAIAPLYKSLNSRLGNKPKRAATIIVLAGLIIIILPAWLFMGSLVEGLQELNSNINAGSLTIPPPTQQVADWPVIGDKVYTLWVEASQNIDTFTDHYKEQINAFGQGLLSRLAGLGGSIVKLIIATVIAGILLATPGTEQTARKFFHKLAGDMGDEFTTITAQTVNNVVKGVIGVAFIQSFLLGLGFLLSGIPYAGLWTLVVLVMAILQLPVLLVTILVVLWLFSELSPFPATLWTIYLLAAGASDNFLKPILLGKGAAVPMVVIFLGVIGGFVLSGFIGLFTGAIIVSFGYKLFIYWLNSDELELSEKTASQLYAQGSDSGSFNDDFDSNKHSN